MATSRPSVLAFNAGELSPRLEGRVDLEKYKHGCRTLENFIPQVQGPAAKRTGTRFVKKVIDYAQPSRLIPFEFGTTDAYILEFGPSKIRVYRNSAVVVESTVAIAASPTGLTNSAGAYLVTTGAAHGYATGDEVYISGTTITAINDQFWTITVTGGTTFTLQGSSYTVDGGNGTSARVYTIASPYAYADLRSIQYAQSADVLYLAHPSHAPRKLTRTGHAAWTLTQITFVHPPFARENITEDDVIVTSGRKGSVELISTYGHFTADHVGAYVRMREVVEANTIEWEAGTAMATNDDRYTGAVGEEAHYEGNVYRRAFSRAGAGSTSGSSPPVHRASVRSDSAGITGATKPDGWHHWYYVNSGYGYVKITSRTDNYRAIGTVILELPAIFQSNQFNITGTSATNPMRITTGVGHGMETGDIAFMWGLTGQAAVLNYTQHSITRINGTQFDIAVDATGWASSAGTGLRARHGGSAAAGGAIKNFSDPHRWAFSAFSAANGYPRAVAFHADRLIWAGTDAEPQTCWASKVEEYEDHETFDQDDYALTFTLNTRRVNTIEWAGSTRNLVLGTAGGIFVVGPRSGEAFSAGTLEVASEIAMSVKASVTPARVGQSLLFPQRAGRALRELAWDDRIADYDSADLTLLAEHVTRAGIAELAYAQEPSRLLWAVMEDGTLAAMTFERGQEVGAWHRHILGDNVVTVDSVAVIPHPDGDRDQVWLVVVRYIPLVGDSTFVEYFEAEYRSGATTPLFMDSAVSYSGVPATTFRVPHLKGETVDVLADTVPISGEVVDSFGILTLASSASVVHVGVPYTAVLETMRLAGETAATQGRLKRVTSIVPRVHETGSGLYIGPDSSRMDPATVNGGEPISGMLGAGSGDLDTFYFPEGHTKEGRVRIEHREPTPCTVTSLVALLVTEDPVATKED